MAWILWIIYSNRLRIVISNFTLPRIALERRSQNSCSNFISTTSFSHFFPHFFPFPLLSFSLPFLLSCPLPETSTASSCPNISDLGLGVLSPYLAPLPPQKKRTGAHLARGTVVICLVVIRLQFGFCLCLLVSACVCAWTWSTRPTAPTSHPETPVYS